MRAVEERSSRLAGALRVMVAGTATLAALLVPMDCATTRPVIVEPAVSVEATRPLPGDGAGSTAVDGSSAALTAPGSSDSVGSGPVAVPVASEPSVTEPSVTAPAASGATPSTVAPTTTPSTVAPTSALTTIPPVDPLAQYRQPGWVAAENARPGTDAWKITADDPKSPVEGYADATSATAGDTVTLFVGSTSPTWRAEAFRMGFYGGTGARLIWASGEQHTEWQRYAKIDQKTGLAEAGWDPSLRIPIDATWPPGAYLVKLTSGPGAHYVPLTIRDDAAPPSLLMVNAVTTWQAYNEWGACSAYKCPYVKGLARANKISFDRPYAHAYNKGSADFLDHERPLIAFAEELGLDLAYATSVDLDAHPELAARHRAVITLGHDEYYTAAMRQALVDARAAGVNLAFLGANAVYRQIRLEPSTDGRARRVLVNYRSKADPIAATDPKLVTVEWHQLGLPPQQLTGMAYQCADVAGDIVLTDTANWVFAGAGASDGMVLRSMAGNEIDRVISDRETPPNVEVIGRMKVQCGKSVSSGNMAYYSTASGAGVFSSGTIWWICGLDAEYCSVPANTPVVRAITANVLRAFADGPAGAAHPSKTTKSG